ncbi:hypothetical protein [Atlantibacter hermannii]|uniref:hypothetical protein n=1 Tax=Atlantibacter hermannii TaxID=565 RepID=UPI0028A0E08F|nr:hypothetical protein [Atlantibacter hermannii]
MIYTKDVVTAKRTDRHGKRDELMKQFNAGELRHPYTGAPVNDRRVLQEVIKIKGL